ncbi:MAG: M48 family metallopeptidase [Pseudomonadota bacterium]
MESVPTKPFVGHFVDNPTGASHEVQVRLGPNGLIFGPQEAPARHHWSYDDLKPVKPMGRSGPAWLARSTALDERLIVGSPEFAAALLGLASQVGPAGSRRRVAAFAGLCLAVLAVFAGIVWLVLSAAPGAIARAVPERWWAEIGQTMEQSLVEDALQCSSRDGQQALTRLTRRFAGAGDHRTIRVYDMTIVNAFAMAGGRVVISNGLIAEAGTPEEVAGVLAHELGHLQARHPETQLVRVIGVQVLLSTLWGGSGIGDLLAQGGALLSILSYTRDAEREADDIALELMKEAKVDPRGLASFFERLKRAGGNETGAGLGRWGDMIRTHPGLDERIDKIRGLGVGDTIPVLSRKDWQQLREICD